MSFRYPCEIGDAGAVDLVFRLATNGVTVTFEVNDEPLFITSAGQFNR